MKTTINNDLIRSFKPCHDPSEKNIPDGENLPVKEWVNKYKENIPISDIFWILLRNDFLTDKQLRLFAVWCAREALKLIDNPDTRSIEACDIAEKFANGEATIEELKAACEAACDAACECSWAANFNARAAAWSARAAANIIIEPALWYSSCDTATCNYRLEKLMENFQ